MKITTIIIVLATLCLFFELESQYKSIQIIGKITDDKGLPIPGTTVTVKGTKQTAIADGNGNFIIKNVIAGSTILITSIGYQSKEITDVWYSDISTIMLTEEKNELKEIEINAGYYTVKEKARTGSISRIDGKTIGKQPVNNPLQALQGRITGLDITQNTGVPGGGFSVRIRGTNSLQSGNDPLYIVNGIQYPSTSLSANGNISSMISLNPSPLSSINPSDIESIEVLKDADATAIYGSRGANGVILITTKKGQAGDLKIDANFYQGYSNFNRKLKLLNTPQYLQMRNEAFANDQTSPGINDYDVNGSWDKNRYTDWQKEFIGKTASSNNRQLSFSGGNANTTFLLSGNYFKENTVFPGDNAYLKKSGLLNLNHSSTDRKLTLTATSSYVLEISSLPAMDLTTSILLPPNAPSLYQPDGSLNWANSTFYNPLSVLKQKYKANTGTLLASGSISYFIVPKLELSSRFGYTKMQRNEVRTNPLSSFDPGSGATANDRTSYYANNWNETVNLEPQISWSPNLGQGKLNVLVGSTIQTTKLHSQTITGTGFVSDGLMENIAAASELRASDALNTDYRYLSYYGRINYNIKDKYILNLTGRRDGSSRFGPANRYAAFGAAGAAWIFSEENFTKNLSFLSFGKLRASYGVTGNDQIGDYKYLELWRPTLNPYQGSSGLDPLGLFNPNYAWETNKKAEISLELGFLKDRIRLSAGYYRNRSSNQLVNTPLPTSVGFSSIIGNLPAVIQNAGWELESTIHIFNKTSFKWSINTNLSIPRNKLVAFPGLEKSAYYSSIYVVGMPLNILKTLQSTGINPTTGIYRFKDFDGDGGISIPGDQQMIQRLGQRYSGGLQNTVTYKGWDLDFLFQFIRQTGKNIQSYITTAPGGQSNQPTAVLKRWQNPGEEAMVQKYTVNSATLPYLYGIAFGDLGISDASYIRLKNLALAYNLPAPVLQKIGLKKAKFYVQGQNLLTITPYKGLDPETQSLALPPLRAISLGLNATL